MKSEKILILSFLAVILLGLVTYWYFKNLLKPLTETYLPRFEAPKVELFSSQGSQDYKEFITPDGKLKLEYLSDWIKMEAESLERFNQEIIGGGAKNLFFAQKFNIEKSVFAGFIIQELVLEEETSLEEIIEIIKRKTEEKGGKMEIEKLEIKDRVAYLEVKYKQNENFILYSKEKIILGENKAYLIILFNFNNNWSGFEEEIDTIFNSAQLID